jgi:uncharacterized protein YggE
MKKNWLLAVSLALVLAMVGLCGCNTTEQINLGSQQEGIHVTGEGEVMAAPDIATLRLGIVVEATTVAEAQSQAKEAMGKVKTALIDNGVAEEDIQTRYFSISQIKREVESPKYWEEEEDMVSYQVTNMVTAKIRDIDEAGTIIDAVAEAGGDLTRVEGINFSVDDPSAYYEEARQKAVADAEDKAEQLAELAGVTLGKPTYISEGISYPIYSRDYSYEISSGLPATPISPGEIEISLTVQVFYDILG